MFSRDIGKGLGEIGYSRREVKLEVSFRLSFGEGLVNFCRGIVE